MPSNDQDDVQRLLAMLAKGSRSGDEHRDVAWRIAAGQEVDEREQERLIGDPDALLELGIASAIFEARGRAHADAERSAAAVLARVTSGSATHHDAPPQPMRRSASRARWMGWPRRAPAILLGSLLGAAALLLTLPFLLSKPGVSVELSEVALSSTRSADPSGLEFRLRIRCPEERYVLVLTVARTGPQVAVVVRHPFPSGPLQPRPADWPTDPFAANSEVLVPPAGTYAMQAAEDSLVLVCSRSGQGFEVEDIDEIRRDVEAACGAWLALEAENLAVLTATLPDDHADLQAARRTAVSRYCVAVATAVRTAGRARWSVDCIAVTAP